MQGYNFTTRVRRALQNARAEASRLGHEFVGTEHMLLGVLLDADSIATMALRNLGIDPVQLRARIEETVKRGPAGQQESRKLPYTPRAKRILELAMKEAQDKQVGYVSTEHLLLGIIREERGVAAQVLVERGATLDSARAEVTRLVRERGIEPPPVEGDLDAREDERPLPDAAETWQAMGQHSAFILLWWLLGVILFLGGARALVGISSGVGWFAWFLVLIAAAQVLGSVLFLIPRTIRVGGIMLVATLVVGFATYALQGRYSARMLVYAAAIFMILALQPRILGNRGTKANS